MSINDAKFSTIKVTQNIILPKGSKKLLDEETGMLNPTIIPNMQGNELTEKQLGLMEKQLGELNVLVKQQNTETDTKIQNLTATLQQEMAQLKTQLANEQKTLGNLAAVTNSDLTTLLKSMLSRISNLENQSK